jgi:hypothetical protein
MSNRPEFSGRGITQINKSSPTIAGAVLPPTGHRQIAPTAVAAPSIADCQVITPVGQKVNLRSARIGGVEDSHRSSLTQLLRALQCRTSQSSLSTSAICLLQRYLFGACHMARRSKITQPRVHPISANPSSIVIVLELVLVLVLDSCHCLPKTPSEHLRERKSNKLTLHLWVIH